MVKVLSIVSSSQEMDCLRDTFAQIQKDDEMQFDWVSSAQTALQEMEGKSYQLAVIDLNILIQNVALIADMTKVNASMCILACTDYPIAPDFNRLMEAGVSGFVCKNARYHKAALDA